MKIGEPIKYWYSVEWNYYYILCRYMSNYMVDSTRSKLYYRLSNTNAFYSINYRIYKTFK